MGKSLHSASKGSHFFLIIVSSPRKLKVLINECDPLSSFLRLKFYAGIQLILLVFIKDKNNSSQDQEMGSYLLLSLRV